MAGLEPATEGSLQISGRIRCPLCHRRPLSSVNPHLFWVSVSDDHPNLAALAKSLICSTVNSADAKRRFSIYNLIRSPSRRDLNQESMKHLCFLAYSQIVGPGF
ncbi:hat family dimerization domain [Plakobranchus ocellatus]|uniref:Hat family dimerization domain n=1 Tax=Plakobranchus ocellatus TaxID=259542 RepID=A0AAV4B8E0_9GAST|nr:hat family dimerization domain [Plakobranchus ocellatus]